MDKITLNAYAKINLTLDVLRKNEIGYHDVEMIMQQVSLCDVITLTKIPKGIEITCDNAYVPTDESNIAYRVAEKVLVHTEGGVHIHIEKHIPVTAGLAGGSSDGAATIQGLNTLYDLGLSTQDMMKMTEDIGKDIPFCIMGACALATGMGEVLEPIASLKDCYIVICKPNIAVSTKEAYEELCLKDIKARPDTKQMIKALYEEDYCSLCDGTVNVFEEGICLKYPVIQEVKKRLSAYEGKGVCMSGSGPSVFAFFKQAKKAEQACENLKRFYRQSFVVTPIDKEECTAN